MTELTLGPQLKTANFGEGGFHPYDMVFDLTPGVGGAKPKRGLWTSTFTNGTSQWEQWAIENMPEWARGTQRCVLIPNDNVKVFHVSGEDDAMKLPAKKLPADKYTTGPQSDDEFAFFNMYVAIDFPKLARSGYDGLHLTKEGASFLKTRSYITEYILILGTLSLRYGSIHAGSPNTICLIAERLICSETAYGPEILPSKIF